MADHDRMRSYRDLELETHIIIARRVSLLDVNTADEMLKTYEGISKMLRSLTRAIEQRRYKSSAT